MSLQLRFISEWLLRKLLHKTPVKMEEGGNTDLKKPRAFSIFSPYVVDENWVCERERERANPDVFPLGLTHLLGFFNDSKIHAIPFLFPLSLPSLLLQSLCSSSFHTSGLCCVSPGVVPICEGQHNCWHYSYEPGPGLDRASRRAVHSNCSFLTI